MQSAKVRAEIGHDWPGYWKGKNEAFVAFASVPFGLDTEGYNIWLYERGGLKMLQDLYGQYNLYALPGGNGGQEMGLFSNKKATKMSDFKGLRVRTPGWYMDIMTQSGASVTPLPGGEVYLALERGVIDAAEFSTPAMNGPSWLPTRSPVIVIQPGVHQPSVQCAFFINKDAWNKLPADLKWIVNTAAKETELVYSLAGESNVEAIKRFKQKVEFVRMDDETITAFAKQTKAILDELKTKYPDVKKVLDSQDAFRKDFAEWREIRSGVAPWPMDDYIAGKRTQ